MIGLTGLIIIVIVVLCVAVWLTFKSVEELPEQLRAEVYLDDFRDALDRRDIRAIKDYADQDHPIVPDWSMVTEDLYGTYQLYRERAAAILFK